MGTLKEPYRLEGKKTMGYEIAEQLDWTLPDVIVYPVGGGMGPIAVYKAFHELQALGWVPSGPLPKLVVTQYEGCAPIVRAFERGETRATLWTDLDVLPGGLKSTAPPGDRGVLDLLAETGGTGVTVSSEVALDTAALMTRTEGLFPCPESATTIAGLATAIERGIVGRDERIVVLVTGSGLKSIPVMPACEPRPTSSSPTGSSTHLS